MYFKDLTQQQVFNLSYLLEYAQKGQLDELQSKYPEIIKKRALDQYRNSVLQTIMLNNISISDLYNWFNRLKQDTNNSIIHFEYIKVNNKANPFNKTLTNKLTAKKINIIDISKNELKEPSIVNISNDSTELELTILVPSKVLIEEKSDFGQSPKKSFVQESAFYFIYIWVNKLEKSITISLPSVSGYNSIWEVNSKKNILDKLTAKTISYLESEIGKIEFCDLTWVNKALRTITNEYYYHNNNKIDSELKHIKNKLKLIEMDQPDLTFKNLISKTSDVLDNEVSQKRISKAIENAIEKELISKFGFLPCNHPFEVFLHEVNKGEHSFKSRNGVSNGSNKSLPNIDTRDIILSILDSSSLKVLGLKYYSDKINVPYKFICKDNWFILEQTNETGTSKELVKHVLAEFKAYKGSEAIINKTTDFKS